MTERRRLSLAFVAAAALAGAGACSGKGDDTAVDSAADATGNADGQAGGGPEGGEGDDAAGGDATSGGGDAGTDVVRDAPDSSPFCEVGAIESESCGRCGVHSRLCAGDGGTWLPYGACTGERGLCSPGDSRSTRCGRCGSRKETCSATCLWTAGACGSEGICVPGDVETKYGNAECKGTEVRTRTCLAACAWSEWTPCAAPKGWSEMEAPPTGFKGRQGHTAVWTGSDMIVWGGDTGATLGDGAAYDVGTNSWKMLPASTLTARMNHVAVWTGTEMIVWGGLRAAWDYRADGASYDPAGAKWTDLPDPPATFKGRQLATAVWTGTEMIIWGGSGGSYYADGAAYSPSTSTWRTLAASTLGARYQHGAIWNGTKMIVFGGLGSSCTRSYCGDAAAYDPKADEWTTLKAPPDELDARYASLALPTGAAASLATFWGGYGYPRVGGGYRKTGATWDDASSTWTTIASPDEAALPSGGRYLASGWWGDSKLWVWGGNAATGAAATGASYDPATKKWAAMPNDGAPSARAQATAIWTGKEAIVWGGSYRKADGRIFRP